MDIVSSDRIWALARAEVLAHEGGFVDHPNDPGGATNFGVSLRYLRSLGTDLGDGDGDGDIDVDDIKALTPDAAAEIFRRGFWGPAGCDQLVDYSGAIAIKVFDTAVNTGHRQAVKLLQRAVNNFGYRLREDGIIGPKTMAVIRAIRPSPLMADLCREQRAFYHRLINHNPELSVFEAGWLRRAAWKPTLAGRGD